MFSVALVALAKGQSDISLAEPCNPVACQLPECRCSTTDIPGGLAARDTPQVGSFNYIKHNLSYQHLLRLELNVK